MEYINSWADELHEKYKHLFEVYTGEEGGYYKPGQILRGIECGEGWKPHVEKLLESLDWHNKNNLRDVKKGQKVILNKILIFQIKEKFGEARVYWQCDNERIRSMVAETVGRFEGKCEITCQRCGKLQYNCVRPAPNGWIYCVCDDCFNGRYKHAD